MLTALLECLVGFCNVFCNYALKSLNLVYIYAKQKQKVVWPYKTVTKRTDLGVAKIFIMATV